MIAGMSIADFLIAWATSLEWWFAVVMGVVLGTVCHFILELFG